MRGCVRAVLQRFGVPSHRYHGKMSSSERSKNQDAFMQRGRRTVMVATNAFGLGIDKPDIRYVMHYQAPASLEQYVQEAGRAGRDGRRANCIMLYSPEDRALLQSFASQAAIAVSNARAERLASDSSQCSPTGVMPIPAIKTSLMVRSYFKASKSRKRA